MIHGAIHRVVARAGRYVSGLLSMLLLLPLLAQAQTYTNASTAYSLIDSSTHSKVGYKTAPYKFNAASGCGTTPPTLDDTLSDLIPIGFNFVFGGTTFTGAYIMSNGRLQFGNTTCGSGTASIGPPQTYPYGLPNASMNGVMKIFGVDLDHTNLVDVPNYPAAASKTPCVSSANCYISVATLGSVPTRQFVVTWKNVPEWVSASNTSGSFDLQIILNEDGSFVYQYGNIVHGGTGTAQIGWQLSTTDFQVLSFGASVEPPPNSAIIFYIPSPVAKYRFDEGGWAPGLAGQVIDSSGKSRPGSSLGNAQPADLGKVCRAVNIPLNTSGAVVDAVKTGVDLSNAALNMLGSGTVAFWFKANTAWASGQAAQLLDASVVSGEWFYLTRSAAGTLYFEVKDSTGVTRSVETVPQVFAANTWVHVSIAWSFNGAAGVNQDNLRIAINGGVPTIASFTSSGTVTTLAGPIHLGDSPLATAAARGTVNSADGMIDEAEFYNYVLSSAQLATVMAGSHSCTGLSFDHLELQHASGNGVTCTPTVITIKACLDAACSTVYTNGLSGTLKSTGATPVQFDSSSGYGSGAAFAIPVGSSSVTKGVQLTSAGSVVLGVAAVSITATGSHKCNFGSPSCTLNSADSGFLLAVGDHLSETSAALGIAAVRKSDSSKLCVPAFASVSRNLTLACGYANPASGTLPVRIAGLALNASGSAAAACDAGGRSFSLAFDATGTASTTLLYADTGKQSLNAQYSGSAATGDTGLAMTGSTSFIAAPASFSFSAITGGPIKAGSAFSATVTARNSAGNATPNFGREAPAEAAALGWVRIQPSGSGAVNGSFSGSAAAFGAGSATAGNLVWSEVGRGDLLAWLASNSYLGSGLRAFGASPAAGAQFCALEGATCTLPGGTTATVYFGENGSYAARTAVGGSIGCNSGVFGDPLAGVAKRCYYVASASASGSVGNFTPHHFDVAVTPACSGSFSYAGQPFTSSVSARNGLASPGTTLNYDGSSATAPNFSRAVTLADVPALGSGSLAGNAMTAAAFTAGFGTAGPSYSFSAKQSAPQTLVLRAIDTDAVSSAGYAEGSTLLRSGRLRLSNATGSSATVLQVPVVAEYWSGNAWLLNTLDSCTVLAAAAVAISNPRASGGAASSVTTTAGAIAISGGSGTLALAAPTPAGSSLSVDLAINLGSTAADQSCQAAHPATTGGAKPWLRSFNGSCAATADRDPAGRASFGVYSPESKKTVHARELF